MEGNDRGRLDGTSENAPPHQTLPPSGTGPSPAQPANSGFDLNQPTIISLLYLASCFLGITAIIGVVLAYVWKDEPREEWQQSHYQYLINTFWLGLVGGVIGTILLIVLIGFIILPLVFVWIIVRCVLSLINAQKKRPMPNPGTLLA